MKNKVKAQKTLTLTRETIGVAKIHYCRKTETLRLDAPLTRLRRAGHDSLWEYRCDDCGVTFYAK